MPCGSAGIAPGFQQVTQFADVSGSVAVFQAEVCQATLGTTFGMMIANVPAVLAGNGIAQRLPVKLIHGIAASIFAVLGVAALLGFGLD